MLHDADVMKQATEALRNPVHVRDVLRSTDRSMSQLESLGTGSFDVLRQMCEDIKRPMQDEEFCRLVAAAEAQKKSAAALEKQKKLLLQKEKEKSEFEKDQGSPAPQEEGAKEAEPPEDDENAVKVPEWVGTFDTNAMASMMQDQNMQSLLAQLVQAMPGPTLKIHPDDPFIDPGFIGQMFHAQTIDSMVRLQESVEKLSMTETGTEQAKDLKARRPKEQPKEEAAAMDSPAALSGLHHKSPAHNFKDSFNLFLQADRESPEVRYKGQLQAMANMGFTDREACIQALHNCDGNMNKAVETLMAAQGDK